MWDWIIWCRGINCYCVTCSRKSSAVNYSYESFPSAVGCIVSFISPEMCIDHMYSQFHAETKRWCKRVCSDYITWQRSVLQTLAWHCYVTGRVEWHFEVSSDGWLCILIALANATGQCFKFAAWRFWQFIQNKIALRKNC